MTVSYHVLNVFRQFALVLRFKLYPVRLSGLGLPAVALPKKALVEHCCTPKQKKGHWDSLKSQSRLSALPKMLQDLPNIIYRTLVEDHLTAPDVRSLRQVSQGCQYLTDRAVGTLKPRHLAQTQVTLQIHAAPYSGVTPLILAYEARWLSEENLGLNERSTRLSVFLINI